MACFSLALLALLSFSPTAIAAKEQRNTEVNDKIMLYKYARYNFTPDEENYIAAHPELAARRAEKDVKFLMDEIDKQINISMNENADYTLLASQTIILGNDATLYSCNTGNKGGSSFLLADWAANYSASSKCVDLH